MDRAIAPDFILRRVLLDGIAQDERLTPALLGADRPRTRRSLCIVLDGFLKEIIDGRELTVNAGEMVVTPEGGMRSGLCTGEVLELDWVPGALGDTKLALGVTRLGPHAMTAARELVRTLARATRDEDLALEPFRTALASTGIELEAEALRAPTPSEDQALHTLIDRQLSSLDAAPMMVDFDELGLSRRTVTRRVTELQTRYGLPGGESWRKVRDHYRLVVASVLLSHEDATPRSVAGLVGYGSVEALHHAFRNAQMASPASFKRMLRAA